MRHSIYRPRAIGAALLIVGLLPFVAAVALALCALVLPGGERAVFQLFVPVDLDAPDNWAVGFMRMAQLFIVSFSVGSVLVVAGAWLRRAPYR